MNETQTPQTNEIPEETGRDLSLNEIRQIMDPNPEGELRLSEEEECDHPENDHGICLSCGKDIFDDLVDQAEYRRDCMEDR